MLIFELILLICFYLYLQARLSFGCPILNGFTKGSVQTKKLIADIIAAQKNINLYFNTPHSFIYFIIFFLNAFVIIIYVIFFPSKVVWCHSESRKLPARLAQESRNCACNLLSQQIFPQPMVASMEVCSNSFSLLTKSTLSTRHIFVYKSQLCMQLATISFQLPWRPR